MEWIDTNTFGCEVVRMASPSQEHKQMQEEKKREELDDKKETNPKALPFHKLLSYADALDWTLMALGTLGSIVHGMARPIGYLLLGKALSAFGDSMNKREHEVDINAYAMVQGLKKVLLHFVLTLIPRGKKLLSFLKKTIS